MASLNKVFLLGNLTRDPDLRSLPSGQAVCELGLAVNRRYTSSTGEAVEEPCFVDVVVWGRSAENCKQFLEKGSSISGKTATAAESVRSCGSWPSRFSS